MSLLVDILGWRSFARVFEGGVFLGFQRFSWAENAAADIFEAFNVVSLGGDFETVSNARWMMTSTGARRAVGRCSMEDLVRNRISTGKKLDFIAVVAVAALGLA